jgi:hypothetical protein
MGSFERWFEALEERHLRVLNFQEVRRAVQALSSVYVERRERIAHGGPFDGAGKRAAFAYFYSPLHYLLVREIVRALGAENRAIPSLLDLGCGTGCASAAWAMEMKQPPRIVAMDRNPWAVTEARWTYGTFHLNATVKVGDVGKIRIPANTGVIAAFTINELDPEEREKMRSQLLIANRRGAPVLIIEPIARRLTAWWDDWVQDWSESGGRQDEWRFRVSLPARLELMDKAAGLDHRELTGRSLWLPAPAQFYGNLP